MKTANTTDTARVELLLAELRLAAVKLTSFCLRFRV
jgi:hypothetical protein